MKWFRENNNIRPRKIHVSFFEMKRPDKAHIMRQFTNMRAACRYNSVQAGPVYLGGDEVSEHEHDQYEICTDCLLIAAREALR